MVRRAGLQILLPRELSPTVVALIGSFVPSSGHGVASLVGTMVRLSILGVLHDAYVVWEGPDAVVALVRCGASLRVPRADLGGMSWPLDADPNPHSPAQLSPDFFAAVTSRPRGEQCGSVEVFESEAVEQRSCHRRVRVLGRNEDKAHPCRAPTFVYTKLFFPWLPLAGIPHCADSYMREQAAYSLLAKCSPAVAPACHHSRFHEGTGSYACVLEDLVATMEFTPVVSSIDKVTQKCVADISKAAPLVRRVFGLLGILHGRFLSRAHRQSEKGSASPTRAAAQPSPLRRATATATSLVATSTAAAAPVAPPSEASPASLPLLEDGPQRDLLEGMVHSHIFYALWRDAVPDTDAGLVAVLDALFGVASAGAGEAVAAQPEAPLPAQQQAAVDTPPPPPPPPEAAADPAPPPAAPVPPNRRLSATTSSTAGRRSLDATQSPLRAANGPARDRSWLYPDRVAPTDLLTATHARSTLTLIHGAIIPAHIRATRDPRAVPNAFLLDWKSAGIGPLEVDLAQALLLLPAATRRAHPELLDGFLDEYTESLRVFYRVELDRTALLCSVRDVCLLLLASGPFEWNAQGAMCRDLASLHVELAQRTLKPRIY